MLMREKLVVLIPMMQVGLSTGRAGRFWTQPGSDPPCVGWEAEGPETDRQRHSVESVLGSGGVRVGSVG